MCLHIAPRSKDLGSIPDARYCRLACEVVQHLAVDVRQLIFAAQSETFSWHMQTQLVSPIHRFLIEGSIQKLPQGVRKSVYLPGPEYLSEYLLTLSIITIIFSRTV